VQYSQSIFETNQAEEELSFVAVESCD